MTLKIIKGDITTLEVDAIVNAANSIPLIGGGVDGAINKAAGPLLYEERKTLGIIKEGTSKITKGYNLKAKYVIHSVGPRWKDGKSNEEKLLTSAYLTALTLAKSYSLNSIAFPLISSGIFGYPKKEAFRVAYNTINTFIEDNKIDSYLVIFDNIESFIPEDLNISL